jgi:hypothetical protein
MSDQQSSFFSPDYATARERFCAMASDTGAKLHRIDLAAKGPEELPLSIDIAVFGSASPTHVVLHSSGIHGVEGFAGSAIQLALMEQLPELPQGSALVLVHVLNPFGMSWLRRVNESNVDLNRNFMEEGEAYEGVPEAYTTLNPMLNPESGPGFDFFLVRTVGSILKHGYTTLKQAIVGGQYHFEKGLFFGGTKLEQGPAAYSDWLKTHLGSARHVVAIDIHTGLGKLGHDTLLVEGGAETKLYQDLEKTFGDRVAPWDPEASVAYAIKGGHPEAVGRILSGATVHFVTQEFGTLPPLKVLHALREENRWHHWGEGHTAHTSKQGILKAFRPDKALWRMAVVDRGQELAGQAYVLAYGANNAAEHN